MGFQFERVYYVCNTVLFGWKNSAFCYHSLNALVASYLRLWGVPIWTYIDDRLGGEAVNSHLGDNMTGYERESRAVYAVVELVVRLGIFISLAKSHFKPARVRRFLGLNIHSIEGAFSIPEDKKATFATLREEALTKKNYKL
jgi:hypothetical protein